MKLILTPVVAAILSFETSYAAVLLEVVVADPFKVDFVGTGVSPNTESSSPSSSILLNGLFSDLFTPQLVDFPFVLDPVVGDLRASGTLEIINSFTTDSSFGSGAELFTLLGSDVAEFQFGVPAFVGSGSLVADASSFAGNSLSVSEIFRPIGTIGDIVVNGETIGEFRIVPEPGSSVLLFLSSIPLCFLRRRKH